MRILALARFVAARFVGLVATLLAASIVIFGSLYLAPGSPLTYLTHGRSMSPAAIATLRHEYRLDESVPAQYWHWLTGVMHGDLGTSILYNTSVRGLLAPRALNTLWLVGIASLVVVLVGLCIGAAAGLKPGRVSNSIVGLATGAMAVPSFVAAVLLTLLFGVTFRIFPVFGSGSGIGDRLHHLVLPALAVAFSAVAFVARMSRAAVSEELASDHVQTAYSRGLSYVAIVRKHVLRNAAVPVLTVAGLTVASLLAGSVVVEQVFQLNGLGSYLVSAVQQKDFPVVQAICLLYVTAVVVMNSVIDIAYALIDPRIAAGEANR